MGRLRSSQQEQLYAQCHAGFLDVHFKASMSGPFLLKTNQCITHLSTLAQAPLHRIFLTELCVLLWRAWGLWKHVPPGGWQGQLSWQWLTLFRKDCPNIAGCHRSEAVCVISVVALWRKQKQKRTWVNILTVGDASCSSPFFHPAVGTLKTVASVCYSFKRCNVHITAWQKFS